MTFDTDTEGTPTMATITGELYVCQDCACMIANGEVGDYTDTELHAARMAEHAPAGYLVLSCHGCEDCDTVRNFWCDGCDRETYGAKHAAAVLVDTVRVSLVKPLVPTLCTYCDPDTGACPRVASHELHLDPDQWVKGGDSTLCPEHAGEARRVFAGSPGWWVHEFAAA